MTPRQHAQAAGERRYHGKPCRRCLNTERDVRQGNCWACHLVRSRERYHNLSGFAYNHRLLQLRRNKALHRMATRQQEAQHRTLQK